MNKSTLIARLRKDRNALSRIEHAEWLRENQQHVGYWFKFRNSYSCPSKPSDYWWVYKKVLKARDRFFDCWEFQTDRDGTHKIGDSNFSSISGWMPCSADEARRAWKKIIETLKQVKP